MRPSKPSSVWLDLVQPRDDAEIEFAPELPQVEPSIAGLPHAGVLALDVPPAHELVEDVVEAGTVGSITGLPELFKSWIAAELAHKVATTGDARLFGRCPVLKHGPVGYFWQDDSRENEIRRVQAYATKHGYTNAPPLRWYFNEGYALPSDLDRLRAEIDLHGFVLVVLDSLYNFLPGIKLKDEDVASVIAAMKRDVTDVTGCTIAFVDHSPWPTDANQGQRRGYGSVFKAAAVRWGIYLDRAGETIFVEARGNNIAGLPRTAALWNPDTLSLQLVEPPAVEEGDTLANRVVEFVGRNPGTTTSVVYQAVIGKDTEIKRVLETDERIASAPPVLFGKPRNAKCWVLASELPSLLDATSAQNGAEVGQTLRAVTDDNVCPERLTPVGGSDEADVGRQPLPADGPTYTDEVERCAQTGCDARREPQSFYCRAHGGDDGRATSDAMTASETKPPRKRATGRTCHHCKEPIKQEEAKGVIGGLWTCAACLYELEHPKSNEPKEQT